jgi:uncharacterized membrane protein YadS
MSINWSSLWKKEDWLANWLGGIFLTLAAIGTLQYIITKPQYYWDIRKAIPLETLPNYLYMFILLLIILGFGAKLMGTSLNGFTKGFIGIFVLALLSFLLGSYNLLGKTLHLSYPFWALVLGLLVSNVIKVPSWLKPAIKTEYYIKIGLVVFGAEVIFSFILKAGALGLIQALVVVITIWYIGYYLAIRMGINKTFAATLASGVSICGVSAAIATGGAVKADPRETAYTVSLVLLEAIPMLILLPFIAVAMNLSYAIAGAWIGGTIDTTGAVVAAGGLVSDKALQVAAITKMSQNVLIGIWAFGLSIWSTIKGWQAYNNAKEEKVEKPSALEIWYRFPKFILGFIAASLVFSALTSGWFTAPIWTATEWSTIKSSIKITRTILFCLAFLGIGLDTKFKELVAMGKGKPFFAYTTAQIINILFTLAIASILWAGV